MNKKIIKGWEIHEKINKGGQGQVYKTTNANYKGSEYYALKLVRLKNEKKRERFKNEINSHTTLSAANAENIIPIIDHNLNEINNTCVEGIIVMP